MASEVSEPPTGADEVVGEDFPDALPHQADATHIVVGDLDDLLEAKNARSLRIRQLL